MKKKFFAILFCAIFIISSIFLFSGCNDDKKYIDEVNTRYEQVDEALTHRMYEHTELDALNNAEITHIRFADPSDNEVNLAVYYKGENDYGYKGKGYAIFNVLINYYNSLVEAEEANNALLYLDALKEIFEQMEFIQKNSIEEEILFELKQDTEENRIKLNEIFNLSDVENDDIVRQIGFLPYHVEMTYYNKDENNKCSYTYKITGISYCEVKSECSDKVKEHEDLIIENSYNKNHIKAYLREMTFTSSTINEFGIESTLRLQGDFVKIFRGTNYPYTVQTTYFNEVNLFDMLDKLKTGELEIKKPTDFDMDAYLENRPKEDNSYRGK